MPRQKGYNLIVCQMHTELAVDWVTVRASVRGIVGYHRSPRLQWHCLQWHPAYSDTFCMSQMIGLLLNFLCLQWQSGYSDTFSMSRGCHCKRGDLYWQIAKLPPAAAGVLTHDPSQYLKLSASTFLTQAWKGHLSGMAVFKSEKEVTKCNISMFLTQATALPISSELWLTNLLLTIMTI